MNFRKNGYIGNRKLFFMNIGLLIERRKGRVVVGVCGGKMVSSVCS